MDPILKEVLASLGAIVVIVLMSTFGFLHLRDRNRFLRRLFGARKRVHPPRGDRSYRPVDPGLAYRLGQTPNKDSQQEVRPR